MRCFFVDYIASQIYALFKRPKKNINHAEVEALMANYTPENIFSKHPLELIVSVTSYPERMPDIHYTLFSLFNQSEKADRIILWLAEEQFPNKEQDLPQKVLDFKKYGLEIEWCHDIRSYKKLIPTINKYPNAVIVTADDDIWYPRDWLKKLYAAYLEDPFSIIGHRGHRIKLKNGKVAPYSQWRKNILAMWPRYDNFVTGCGGVLYPPRSLYKDVCKEDLFQKLAPYADDIWFWAMAVLNDTKIKNIPYRMHKMTYVNLVREKRQTGENTLAKINITNGGNDRQLKQVIEAYPELKSKIGLK